MAILFVTVFVVEAETAVETSTLPVTAGIVTVFEPLTAGTDRVILPDESPAIEIELIVVP